MAGYCRNDDLVRAYNTMHALIYPRHGTDESCRTIREALAAGLPVVAGNTGAAKSLIQHGRTGFAANLSADAITEALASLLARSEPERANIRDNAAADANERFSRVKQAEKAIAFYARLQSLK